MLETLANYAWQIWTTIAVICLILELGSGDLFLLSFAISAAVTAIIAFLGAGIYVQLLVFAVVSLLTLLLVRPSLLKALHKGEDKRNSNVDALKGKTGVVTEDIPEDNFGRVMLGGDDWKAKTVDGKPLKRGAKVKFVSRDSLILTVEEI